MESPSLRLDTLPPGLPPLHRTVGPQALEWAVEYLIQPNGPRAGQRWIPTPRQARYLAWWYAVDDNGEWLFRHGCRRLAKGSGKSPAAAVFALIEFAGPCRVADLGKDFIRAKPVDLPLVQIAATSEDQTANTMRMVRAMAGKNSRVAQEHGLDPGKMIYHKLGGGELKVITSSAVSAEGAESTAVIADETEHWIPSNGGVELYATLDRNLAKSGSRMMETANAWQPGADSAAETTYTAWVAEQEGKTRGDTQILYDAVIAPPDVDLTDEKSLTSALEFVYEDCPWVNIPTIRDRIWDTRFKEDQARRFYLNQPTASMDAWITPQEWGACADSTKAVDDGDRIALFFDGSKSRDATALIGCRIDDGHVFTLDVWEPDPEHTTDDVVDVEEVDAAVSLAFERFEVAAFWADVREWESFTKVHWPKEYGKHVELWAERDVEPIAWDMRTKLFDFTKAVELAEAEIRDKTFTHDGDSRVARHVANCRRKTNRYGYSLRKESRDSAKKIDAAICVIGARMVRRAVLQSETKGVKKKRARTGRAGF